MTYHLPGLIFFLIGCSHLFSKVDQVEPEIVRYVQQKLKHKPLLILFKEIWFIGRTSFALIVLVFMICIDWKNGLVAAVVFFVFVGIEQLIKTLYFRKRPYASHQVIAMLQPLEPFDSSFPSGDALRVWYLALIVPVAAGGNTLFLAATIYLAIMVTLGRMVMGVHYLSDTLSGAGLGILGAGTTIWLWNLLNFL